MALPSRGDPEVALSGLLSEATMLCGQVERGHGRGTLATRFEQLKVEREPGVLALALSEEAATAFGRWLRGLSGAGSAQRPPADGRVDVPRGDDRWARIALVTAPLSSPAFPSAQVAAEVAGGAVLLLLVGTHRDALTGQAREVFRDVLGVVPLVQPVVVAAGEAGGAAPPWCGDAALGRSLVRLDSVPFSPETGVASLSGAVPPVVKLGAALARARALHVGVESLGVLLTRETARQRALKAREDRMLRILEGRPGSGGERDGWEKLRQALDEGLAKIGRQLEEQNRRTMLPGSALNHAVSDLLRSLSKEDLEQTEAYNEIRIAIRSDFATRLLDAAKREIRNQFKEDVQQIKTGAEACRDSMGAELERLTGVRQPVPAPHVDEAEIWRSLREALALELNYRGSLPKRGFWQRIAEGKQLMFTMLSLVGLVGMVFGFSRSDAAPFIALALPVVFIIGIALTFMNWTKEDAARMEKELERIREQVGTEVKRLIGEIQREKMTRLKEVLDTLRKEFGKRAESVLKDHQAATADRANRQRGEARDRQRVLETRMRELQPLSMQLSRLRQGSADAQRDIQDALRAIPKAPSP